MNCILFLAPISAFDQVLEEDPTVNRLEDSVLLWKSIVSNKLLAATNIVLFLNKTDILKQKLQAGIKFADHLVSYGDRPNDFESTSYCTQIFLCFKLELWWLMVCFCFRFAEEIRADTEGQESTTARVLLSYDNRHGMFHIISSSSSSLHARSRTSSLPVLF